MQYFNGAAEVTAQVTGAGGLKRPNVPAGARRAFTLKVTPRSGLAVGERLVVLVQAESERDPAQRDAIKARTRVK